MQFYIIYNWELETDHNYMRTIKSNIFEFPISNISDFYRIYKLSLFILK